MCDVNYACTIAIVDKLLNIDQSTPKAHYMHMLYSCVVLYAPLHLETREVG